MITYNNKPDLQVLNFSTSAQIKVEEEKIGIGTSTPDQTSHNTCDGSEHYSFNEDVQIRKCIIQLNE